MMIQGETVAWSEGDGREGFEAKGSRRVSR
jgi:hypothetical protein